MGNAAFQLYGLALQTALILALPVVGLVALIGILIALIQTVLGIQDQNISFGPKIAAVAVLAAIGGLPGMALLASLVRAAILSLPRLTG